MSARARLAARQEEVLAALLRGEVPAGFDPAGATLTSQVLARRRADAALRAAPELVMLPGWRGRFDRHALARPHERCAHADVEGFVAGLAAGDDPDGQAWCAVHEVYEGRRRLARVRLDGRRVTVGAVAGRVWVIQGRRDRRRPAGQDREGERWTT